MKKSSISIIAFTLATLFFSCDSNRVFDNSIPLENAEWERSNIISQEVFITDTTKTYNMFLNLRNTKSYKYSNLYVFLETEFPNGKSRKDTIECPLADKKGAWYGKSAGSLVENKIMFNRNRLLPDTGTYIFRIEQAMREKTLPGISDVGIRVEYTK